MPTTETARLLAALDGAARAFDARARDAAARAGWPAVEHTVNHVAKLSALFFAQTLAGARSAAGRDPLTAPTTEFVNIPPELEGVLGGLAVLHQAAEGMTDAELDRAFTSFDGATMTARDILVAAAAHYGEHARELR